MDLTIVIVNWNGGSLLMRCLASVRAHAREASVIVVDNNSVDGSREATMAQFPEFLVINSGGNLGFGRANNLARALTRTSLVLFLNPDTELMSGTLRGAIECLNQRRDVGALGCKMINPDGHVQELGLQWPVTLRTLLFERLLVSELTKQYFRRWLPVRDPETSGYVSKLYGGFMMVRREALETAGWFDERYFMYAEDADLSQTLVDLGWKLYYCSEAAILHVGGGVTAHAPSAFSILMMQDSLYKLVAKYQGPMAASLYRAVVFSGALLRLGVGILGGIAAIPRRNSLSAAYWKTSRVKQRQLALWSIGVLKAKVPESRMPTLQLNSAE